MRILQVKEISHLKVVFRGQFPGMGRSEPRGIFCGLTRVDISDRRANLKQSSIRFGEGDCLDRFRTMFKPQSFSHTLRSFSSSEWVQLGRKGRVGRISCVMEKMEISKEQILQEEQRIQEEELYLGKEESSDAGDNSDEVVANSDKVAPELKECWDLWQRVGLPVAKIAKQRNMTETGVFFCIFTCIQNDYYVDWYELCKEAQFTPEIAKRLIQATEKQVAEAEGGPVELSPLMKLSGSSGITEVHFGLYMTMVRCGFSYQTILNIASQRSDDEPVMDWGEASNDDERFPTLATEAGMLKWLMEKDGASLLEIALKFRECDEVELMRLLLKLEENGKIFRRQGIFRAM